MPCLIGDQRELVDGILPAPEAEVESAAEDVGLVAGLAVQGDDRAFRQRPAAGPELFHDADAVVGDIARGEPGEQEEQDNDHGSGNRHSNRNQPGQHKQQAEYQDADNRQGNNHEKSSLSFSANHAPTRKKTGR